MICMICMIRMLVLLYDSYDYLLDMMIRTRYELCTIPPDARQKRGGTPPNYVYVFSMTCPLLPFCCMICMV